LGIRKSAAPWAAAKAGPPAGRQKQKGKEFS